MTKIYEALERVSRERLGRGETLDVPFFSESPLEHPDLHVEEEMISLYRNIESRLPQSPKRIIQFIGAQKGEGTSSIAREFAKTASFRLGKTILLLDADRMRPTQHLFFQVNANYGWVEALQKNRDWEGAFSRVENTSLFISPSCNSATFTPEIYVCPQITVFWEMLRNRFDLVVVDAAPLSASPDGLAVAPFIDGTILVVAAERTRARVAVNVIEKISKVGGNILGLVFNKRRYYIPKFIYKRL